MLHSLKVVPLQLNDEDMTDFLETASADLSSRMISGNVQEGRQMAAALAATLNTAPEIREVLASYTSSVEQSNYSSFKKLNFVKLLLFIYDDSAFYIYSISIIEILSIIVRYARYRMVRVDTPQQKPTRAPLWGQGAAVAELSSETPWLRRFQQPLSTLSTPSNRVPGAY